MSLARGEAVIVGGSATITPVRVYVKGSQGQNTFAKRIKFRNEEPSTGNLMVSLNGTVFASIAPLRELELDGVANQYVVKSSAGTVAYSAVYASAS